jgi:hypothetical protein
MINMVKNILVALVPRAVSNWFNKINGKIQLNKWNKNGRPVPAPHIVKQMLIKEYKDKYGYSVLVETGTFKGDMVEAQKKRFRKIFSIELGADLYEKAVRRFKKDKNVKILQGDSGIILPEVMLELNEPAIFFLDGHYSSGITAKGEKDCPIYGELDAIFNSTDYDHVLLIDDARCFVGQGDYPTINELTEYIRSKNNKYQVEVKHDVIRYVIKN